MFDLLSVFLRQLLVDSNEIRQQVLTARAVRPSWGLQGTGAWFLPARRGQLGELIQMIDSNDVTLS